MPDAPSLRPTESMRCDAMHKANWGKNATDWMAVDFAQIVDRPARVTFCRNWRA
jgi:hypothetical protein